MFVPFWRLEKIASDLKYATAVIESLGGDVRLVWQKWETAWDVMASMLMTSYSTLSALSMYADIESVLIVCVVCRWSFKPVKDKEI